MSTILAQVRAERNKQTEEEARPPICGVDEARRFIEATKPAPMVNINLEMCVLFMEEVDSHWNLCLIDKELEPEYEDLHNMIKDLDPARRNRFIFQLTIWKNKIDEYNELDYQEGFSYRFEKVHALKIRFDCPMGNMQIRRRILAKQLPLIQSPSLRDVAHASAQQKRATYNSRFTKTLVKRRLSDTNDKSTMEVPTKKTRGNTAL